MIFVIVKVVNGALTVRNGRAREQSSPTHNAIIQARVELIFVVKNLQSSGEGSTFGTLYQKVKHVNK